ncbi:MAG: pyridoxamine 5'-phosphate oxidase family protein [Bernardetiaceae bacterium]|jgi:hypothetical protein|nr:pyridoxamine 5'-phosphate oxidase family protein [Bernardetiaceae bacterium]
MLTPDQQKALAECVLCWLATADAQGQPNVSPKEMFVYLPEGKLLIANLASPNSVRNLAANPLVCVSLVNIFTQKGFKLKGSAQLIAPSHPSFPEKAKKLTAKFSDRYPILSLIEVAITQVATIKAPSYFLFPETTEQSQTASAMRTYGVQPA